MKNHKNLFGVNKWGENLRNETIHPFFAENETDIELTFLMMMIVRGLKRLA